MPHAPDTAARVQTEAPSPSIQQFCCELPALIKTEANCDRRKGRAQAVGGTKHLLERSGRTAICKSCFNS